MTTKNKPMPPPCDLLQQSVADGIQPRLTDNAAREGRKPAPDALTAEREAEIRQSLDGDVGRSFPQLTGDRQYEARIAYLQSNLQAVLTELDRLRAVQPNRNQFPQGSCVCMDCGLPYREHGSDITLPDDQWNMIHDSEGGLLCGRCMAVRVSQLDGSIAIRAKIEFGRAAQPDPAEIDHVFKGMATDEQYKSEALGLAEVAASSRQPVQSGNRDSQLQSNPPAPASAETLDAIAARDLVWSSALCEAVGGLFSFTEGNEKEVVKDFVGAAIAAAWQQALRQAAQHVPTFRKEDDPIITGRGCCSCGGAVADGVTPYKQIWEQHILSLPIPHGDALAAYAAAQVKSHDDKLSVSGAPRTGATFDAIEAYQRERDELATLLGPEAAKGGS